MMVILHLMQATQRGKTLCRDKERQYFKILSRSHIFKTRVLLGKLVSPEADRHKR